MRSTRGFVSAINMRFGIRCSPPHVHHQQTHTSAVVLTWVSAFDAIEPSNDCSESVFAGPMSTCGSLPTTPTEPRVHDATAAKRLATIAKSSAACNPALKGVAINPGKKLRPVRAACWVADKCERTLDPTRCWTGL